MDPFEELLLKNRGKRFLVVHPPGEKGDYLIFLGLEKKLKELNINHEILYYKIHSRFTEYVHTVNRILSKSGLKKIGKLLMTKLAPVCTLMDKKANIITNNSFDIILLRGGGYLNDLWKDYCILGSILSALCSNPKSMLIISPQSFYFKKTDFSEIFKMINQEVHIFCREKYSFDLLSAMDFSKNVHIQLSPDTALYLTRDDFDIQSSQEPYILISPRTDIESVTNWKIKAPSKIKVVVGDAIKIRTFSCFVNTIANARQVYTDRIHVAVFSTILGNETFLYPNSYYKNKGMYEFSLINFKNVHFIESKDFLGFDS